MNSFVVVDLLTGLVNNLNNSYQTKKNILEYIFWSNNRSNILTNDNTTIDTLQWKFLITTFTSFYVKWQKLNKNKIEPTNKVC